MRWSNLDKEACSVARTVSVIGDRWTLLILRDCFLRVRRFEEFQARLGITRPILTSRLRKLVKEFVLTRVPYQERPLRHEYRLTQKGLDLYPVVMSIVHWGDVHMAGRKGRPLLHQHANCGKTFDPVMTCSACGEPVNPRQVHVHRGPGAVDPRHLLSAALVADAGKRRATPASRASRSRHQKPTSSSE
jgi:DNA-binding HxlR family transcriptional regulator